MKKKMLKLLLLFLVICLFGSSQGNSGECKMTCKMKCIETTGAMGGGKKASEQKEMASGVLLPSNCIFFY